MIRTAKEALALVRRKKLLTSNVHTEKGSHASIRLSWDRWAKPPLRQAARRISFEDATLRIREACGGALPGLALHVS